MNKELEKFVKERERLDTIIKDTDNLTIKRFLNLDKNVYKEDKLSRKTKELLGLVASIVLRCDDCIYYHLLQCRKQQITTAELEETAAIAMVVGGSITIPHIRRMMDNWHNDQDSQS